MKKIHSFSITEILRAYPKQTALCCATLVMILITLWLATPQRFVLLNFAKVTEPETLRLRLTKYFPPSIWLFKQSPVMGTGLWSYRNLVYEAQARLNQRHPGFFDDYSNPKPRRVHNEFLEVLNDGGLIAAVSLSLFLVVVMRHGWLILKNVRVGHRERTITAACFCTIVALFLTSFFFFPFRLNSTLFMTAVMMGLMEGIYLRNGHLITRTEGRRSITGWILMPPLLFVLIGLFWITGMKPFRGEVAYTRYKMFLDAKDVNKAERSLIDALDLDPHNTAYHMHASSFYLNVRKDYQKAHRYIMRAILDFNGDVPLWSIYFVKGFVAFRTKHLKEARSALEKALYYNPNYEPARQLLNYVNKGLVS